MTLIDRRILIADLAYLGDTLMTTPVVTNLRRNHPRAVIDFLASSQSAVIVQNNPDLNEVIVVDKAAWLRPTFQTLRETADRLKTKKYDTAFVVHRAMSTALTIFMAGIPRRVGLATQGRSLLLTDAVPLDITRHRTDNALALLTQAGEPVSSRSLVFHAAIGASQRAEGLLLSRQWNPERPLVCVAPGGSWATKIWPEERFGRAMQALNGAGYQLALVGGPGEVEQNKRIAALADVACIDLTGATSIDVLYEVFRLAQGVLATDSGPMHLAAAANAPVVGLFGPTAPARCGPIGANVATLAGEVPCLGCYFKACDHHSCMAYLGVRTVVSTLERVMLEAGAISVSVPQSIDLEPVIAGVGETSESHSLIGESGHAATEG